jgi:hypothetical protein
MAGPTSERRALAAATALAEPLRYLLLPLGAAALLAVGIHAAADVLSDQFLSAVDRADALLDSLFATFSLTAPLVDLVGLHERVLLARGTALLFELWADLVLALPALGVGEETAPLQRLRELGRRLLAQPSTLRLTRGPYALAFALAGSCSVARLVQGALFASLRRLLGSGLAAPLCSLVALLVLAALATTVAWKAVLQIALHADGRSEPPTLAAVLRRGPLRLRALAVRRRLLRGLPSAVALLPLALAALLRAAPLTSFFR